MMVTRTALAASAVIEIAAYIVFKRVCACVKFLPSFTRLGLKSFTEGLRACGLQSPSAAEQRVLHNGSASFWKDGDRQLAYVLKGLAFLQKRLAFLNPDSLTAKEREELRSRLTSLVQLHEHLKPWP
jgi:hypothetical protein